MVLSKKKTYQYVMTEDECQLFNLLRRLENDSIDLVAPKNHPRLNERFSLSLSVEGKHLRHYAVDAHQIVQEAASKAADYLREVMDDNLLMEEPDPLVEIDTASDYPFDIAPDSDDRDSVLGARSVIIDPNTRQNDSEMLSWEALREKYIPQSVKVTFNAAGLDDDLVDELRRRFPGVDLTRTPTRSSGPEQDTVDSSKKPRGVKTMIIELDEEEITNNPAVEDKVREQYPWATIQTKASPNTSKKRKPQSAGRNVANGPELDPGRHLCDLAELTSEPPSTQEFEYYNSQVHEGWDTLEFCRKFDIAHARAIQSQYGKVVDGGGCGHCVQAGYKCKAYISTLHNISTLALGASCQNCRLKGIACDLAPVAKDHYAQAHVDSNPKTLRLDTSDSTIQRLNHVTNTNPTAFKHKPSLASRISPAGADVHIKGAALFDEMGSPSSISTDTRTLNSAFNGSLILQFAESIGIHFDLKVGKVIQAMWAHLQQYHEIKAYGTRTSNLMHYYSNLVTLYILAYQQDKLDLAYIILLRFQNTNYNRTSILPNIEVAVQAFEYLPSDSPLCQWLAIMYSFLWDTQNEGDYKQFMQDRPGLNTLALSKLLYAVAYDRDPFTEGHDAAVLLRWCNVHGHADGSPEQKLCEKSRVSLKLDLQEATRIEKARMLADAQKTMEEYGCATTWDGQAEQLDQNSPVRKGKRKNEKSPVRPFKKSKRGGSYGSGR